jgi:hypothetical protein
MSADEIFNSLFQLQTEAIEVSSDVPMESVSLAGCVDKDLMARCIQLFLLQHQQLVIVTQSTAATITESLRNTSASSSRKKPSATEKADKDKSVLGGPQLDEEVGRLKTSLSEIRLLPSRPLIRAAVVFDNISSLLCPNEVTVASALKQALDGITLQRESRLHVIIAHFQTSSFMMMEEKDEQQAAVSRLEARRHLLESSIDTAASSKTKIVPEKDLGKLDSTKRQKYEEQLLLQSKRTELERELASVSAARVQNRLLKEYSLDSRSLSSRLLQTLGFSQDVLVKSVEQGLSSTLGLSKDIWNSTSRSKARRYWQFPQLRSGESTVNNLVDWLYGVFLPAQDLSDSDPLWVPSSRTRCYIAKPPIDRANSNQLKFRLVERFEVPPPAPVRPVPVEPVNKRLKSEIPNRTAPPAAAPTVPCT